MITKDMLLGEILDKYPELAQVLMNCGMHCVSCFAAAMENLEEACLVHGLNPDTVLDYINDFLADEENGGNAGFPAADETPGEASGADQK